MRFVCLAAVLLLVVGCQQKVVVELTPLEEYALALQVFDRENAKLTEAERHMDPKVADDAQYLEECRQRFQVAKKSFLNSYRRFNSSVSRD